MAGRVPRDFMQRENVNMGDIVSSASPCRDGLGRLGNVMRVGRLLMGRVRSAARVCHVEFPRLAAFCERPVRSRTTSSAFCNARHRSAIKSAQTFLVALQCLALLSSLKLKEEEDSEESRMHLNRSSHGEAYVTPRQVRHTADSPGTRTQNQIGTWCYMFYHSSTLLFVSFAHNTSVCPIVLLSIASLSTLPQCSLVLFCARRDSVRPFTDIFES